MLTATFTTKPIVLGLPTERFRILFLDDSEEMHGGHWGHYAATKTISTDHTDKLRFAADVLSVLKEWREWFGCITYDKTVTDIVAIPEEWL